MAPIRVVICGTYPTQFNGYSKVLYELLKELAVYKDLLQISVFGFQNYYENNKSHELERSLPLHIELYDAYKNENPREKGFGENLIEAFIKERDPDVVVVYNDLIVLSTFLQRLDNIPNRRFRIVPYIDLVYENEKNALVNFVHTHSDGGIMFTKFWDNVIKSQGFTKPTFVLEHGFNPNNHYPIPRHVARAYFNIPDNDFVIINLNRNQPRKRWDICMMTFVKFLSMHQDEPVRLIVGTALTGGWDLVDIFVSECRKYGMDPEKAKHHLILVNNPQQLTDKDVNILYNAADVGLNTCDGEGFGLCNFEQGGIGIPQVVTYTGGFKDFFDSKNTVVVPPRWSYYVDSLRDAVGGEGRVCDIADLCSALNIYYKNPEIRAKHGAACRERIAKNEAYKWAGLAAKFKDYMIAASTLPITQPGTGSIPSGIHPGTGSIPSGIQPGTGSVPSPASAPASAPEPVEVSEPLSPVAEEEPNVDVRKLEPVQVRKTDVIPVESVVPKKNAILKTETPAPVAKPVLKDVTVFQGMEDIPVIPMKSEPAPASVPAPVPVVAPASVPAPVPVAPLAPGDGTEAAFTVSEQAEDSDDEELDLAYLEKLNKKISKLLVKKRTKAGEA